MTTFILLIISLIAVFIAGGVAFNSAYREALRREGYVIKKDNTKELGQGYFTVEKLVGVVKRVNPDGTVDAATDYEQLTRAIYSGKRKND